MSENNITSSVCFLEDCINGMKRYPDLFFDIAIVDPPFGIGQNWSKDKKSKHYKHRNNFNNSIPNKEYFDELFRCSKNQIIWGCNYYWNYLRPSNNLIYWRKGKDTKKQFGSAGELAWTSFSKYPLLEYDFIWNGCCVCEPTEKIHPHQKPVKLYDQCLFDFAKKGDKILDTHTGSGSSRIACAIQGFDFVGFENQKLYFDKQEKRFQQHTSKLRISNW
jgi:site-specific DNA-methyltransferase (adenine-specific)